MIEQYLSNKMKVILFIRLKKIANERGLGVDNRLPTQAAHPTTPIMFTVPQNTFHALIFGSHALLLRGKQHHVWALFPRNILPSSCLYFLSDKAVGSSAGAYDTQWNRHLLWHGELMHVCGDWGSSPAWCIGEALIKFQMWQTHFRQNNGFFGNQSYVRMRWEFDV